MSRRALFLDRDGTLMIDTGYVRDPRDVELLPGTIEGLRVAHDLGLEIIVVSNQSGLARGIIAPAQLHAVQARLEELLGVGGVKLDGVYFCPHGPDEGCACRKPKAGMLLDAAKERGIDLARSVMVGDGPRDIEAGKKAGCRTIFIGTGPCDPAPDFAVTSFQDIPSLLRDIVGT